MSPALPARISLVLFLTFRTREYNIQLETKKNKETKEETKNSKDSKQIFFPYPSLDTLTFQKRIRDGTICCGWEKRRNPYHRDRLLQHRGKNGRRGPYGRKINQEDQIHVLSRTLTHIVNDNDFILRVCPGKYKVDITYGDVAFNKTASLSVNGHSFIEQDEQKDFNVKARSIVVHTSDNIIEHPDTIAYYQVRSRSPGHNVRTLPSKNTGKVVRVLQAGDIVAVSESF